MAMAAAHEHRRVDAQKNTDRQRQREVVQRRTTKEEHRKRHRQGRAVRDHRTRDRRRNGRVDHLNRFRAAHLAEVFTNTVENNHGLVNGVTQTRPTLLPEPEARIPVQSRKDPTTITMSCRLAMMRCNSELPFESHRQVNDDAGHNEQQSRQTVGRQVLHRPADPRTRVLSI